jgi:hypothetical protein
MIIDDQDAGGVLFAVGGRGRFCGRALHCFHGRIIC